MKKFSILLTALLLLASCSKGYKVTVTFPDDSANGETAFLTDYDTGDTIATATVENNACTFEGVIKNEHKIDCYVLAKDKNGFTYKLYCRLNNDIFNNNSDNIIYDTDGNEAARFYSLI